MMIRTVKHTQLLRHIGRSPRTYKHLRAHRSYATTSDAVEDFDVVIIGGGPAGLAFASALAASSVARNSLRIGLIEAGNLDRIRNWPQDEKNSYSNRVSSITNESKRFLTDIGGWKYINDSRTCPMEDMQVWDGISDSRIVFSATDIDDIVNSFKGKQLASTRSPQLAQLTENLNLQRSLLLNLDQQQVVDILDNTTVSAIESESQLNKSIGGGWPILYTSNGRKLRARLLVGADGPNSPVRKYARIESYGWAYDTRAIVATLFHPPRLEGLQKPNTTAYQRFLPTGPIAFLPLSSTASSLVWSTKPSLATALSFPPSKNGESPSSGADPEILKLMVNAAFRLPELSVRYLHDLILDSHATGDENKRLTASQLAEEIRWRERSHGIEQDSAFSCFSPTEGMPPVDAEALPPLVTRIQPGTLASFPLRMNHADAYVGEDTRTVLIGDAAHTIHPLAGQGLNMGLADAEALADAITSAVTVGCDIGSKTALLPYTRSRYFENHKLLSVTDKLHKLYSSTAAPVVWARSVGLEVVNELDSVKAALMFSAGASSSVKDTNLGTSVSYAAARAFELGNGAVNTVGLLSRSALGLARAGLDGVVRSYSEWRRN